MSEKPRCLIQSKTPGQATIYEAIEYIGEAMLALQDRVAMPAQDHGYNCLQQAYHDLKRMAGVDAICDHDWVWAAGIKLMYPPLRRRRCSKCLVVDTRYASEYDGGPVADWER